MPRLPTPIAMRAPGLRFSPKRADASSFCTVEEISATRRSGNFWWMLRRGEKLINLEYGEARCIWERPGIEEPARPHCPVKAIARRAFSLLPFGRWQAEPQRKACESGRRRKARRIRRHASIRRRRKAASYRRAIRESARRLAGCG